MLHPYQACASKNNDKKTRMKKYIFLIPFSLFLLGCSDQADNLPVDVKNFIERRNTCIHFANEETTDEDRAEFIHEQIDTYCPGNEIQQRRLAQKYKDKEHIIRALSTDQFGNTMSLD